MTENRIEFEMLHLDGVERPTCDKCHLLMSKNGAVKTKKGTVYRFRCHYCGASKHVLKKVEP